ncbi:SDR family NAD(P)-dependent oxidoreductase [Hyunsoonleella ulvae]|uniref:SDR family NAD(P)-dependent oxidoreductase n=1 Tax=Hyunsoonleella ulvae TaxID=2799948 RepID=UPI00193A9014|nr:SDR family NAD(P)-dependent oxidoreductase [Hyunsoonleella ulvae]
MEVAVFERIKGFIESCGLISEDDIVISNSLPHDFSEETILITGAAGSIGSGIIKKILSSKFKKLVLLDNAETPLFLLKRSVSNNLSNNVEFILGDIRDESQMSHLFRCYKPTLIFHAAAYKHVSVVEDNPYEAIKTNIFATQLLSQLAIKHASKRFIFISTDKAANPAGIMGMTKSIAEKHLTNLNINSTYTKFVSARFGNIFGSNGSVVPLFIKQLKKGKQISVTHKEASRLFIDINEACSLIIELTKLDIKKNHSIVSFDMGDPIRIIDLAKVLISLLQPSKPYETLINITDLHPGEKLHESITSKSETLKPSGHEKIFYLFDNNETSRSLNLKKLYDLNNSSSLSEVKRVLQELCNI